MNMHKALGNSGQNKNRNVIETMIILDNTCFSYWMIRLLRLHQNLIWNSASNFSIPRRRNYTNADIKFVSTRLAKAAFVTPCQLIAEAQFGSKLYWF